MVLEKLAESLRNTLSKITSALFVDERLVNELVKDIQKALLQGDVNVVLVSQLSKKIKERILKEEAPAGVTKKEYLAKVVYEELANFLGSKAYEIRLEKKPTVILLVGLFGNGKTTTAGKLAKFYRKRGLKVALVQTDTWRPAAFEQLQQLAGQVGVDFFGKKEEKDPSVIFRGFQSQLSQYDVVIVDSAGRDALSDDLIVELNDLQVLVRADERLLVMSADLGQTAQKQAQAFHDAVKVTGVVITKLDGTSKGGGALSACAITGAPVAFISVGEKVDEFEVFDPQRFVGRLLGMGDLQALLEKAREALSEEKAQDMGKKFLKGEFNLLDLYEQMSALKSMGSLRKLVEMIPGFSSLQLPKEMLDVQEEKLKRWRFLMDSMTKEELEDPEVISGNRIERVAKGAGRDPSELRELLKQYKQSKKMVKMFKGKDMNKVMKQFGGQFKGMGV